LSISRKACNWRRCRAADHDCRQIDSRLNAFPQFIIEIDGLDIHFIHLRSKQADALPLIVTHGWPGSIIEQLKIVDPLRNPLAYGESASDAFDVVIPSLLGYGFSGKPTSTGWYPNWIARAWAVLMQRLGYKKFVAQGGDWGDAVTEQMALLAPVGSHLGLRIWNFVAGKPLNLRIYTRQNSHVGWLFPVARVSILASSQRRSNAVRPLQDGGMVDRTRHPGQKRRPKRDGQGSNRWVVNPALDRPSELIELREERAELPATRRGRGRFRLPPGRLQEVLLDHRHSPIWSKRWAVKFSL
jgi:pimeloyl-ACP methyl ester carboxylesterase